MHVQERQCEVKGNRKAFLQLRSFSFTSAKITYIGFKVTRITVLLFIKTLFYKYYSLKKIFRIRKQLLVMYGVDLNVIHLNKFSYLVQ